MIKFKPVTSAYFVEKLKHTQKYDSTVKEATTPWEDITDHKGVKYYMSNGKDYRGREYKDTMGYAISSTGELTSAYSMLKGHGKILATSAVKNGASNLDCFDGFLPKYWGGFGFVETKRVANYTKGGPDVVYMTHKDSLRKEIIRVDNMMIVL